MSLEQSPARYRHSSQVGTPEVYLTEREAAQLLKVSVRTLQRWRQEGLALPFRRFGGMVRYAASDIHSWAAKQSRLSTSEAGHDAV